MNKLTKLLSVFALAGAIGAGVAGAAGCAHKHTYEEKWTSGGADGHYHVATCHEDQHDAIKPHTWDDDKDTTCNDCGYTRTVESGTPTPTPSGEKLEVAADVKGLIIEGIATADKTATLSTDKTSHDIAKASIKVYFAIGDSLEKGTEVPAANLVLTLKDPSGADCTDWTGLKKDGNYIIYANLKDAKLAAGSTFDEVSEITATETVTVNNPLKANSLEVKTGTLTQSKSVQNKMSDDWTYTLTRANGDKEDYTGTVTVTVETNSVGTKTATLTSGNYSGSVEVTITDATNHSETYAVNLGGKPTGVLADEAPAAAAVELFKSANGNTKLEARGVKIEENGNSSAQTCGDKYFANRAPLAGATFTSNGGLQTNQRYFILKTEGAAQLTIYWSRNNGNDERGVSVFNSTAVEGGDISKLTPTTTAIKKMTNGTAENATTQAIQKMDVNIPAAGTYWITSANNQNVYFYYIELSTEFDGEGTDIVLEDGANTLVKVDVSHTTKDYKQEFTVGDTFTVDEGYSVKGTYIAANTAKKSEQALNDVTYWIGNTQLTPGTTVLTADMFTALGDNNVTVKYGQETVTGSYKIFVDSAVSGITGITAKVKSTVNKEVEDGGTAALGKTDIEVNMVGTNANAQITATTVKYRLKTAAAGSETEITDSANLSVGTYVIIVSATVEDATAEKSATFETSIEFMITVAGAKKVIAADTSTVTQLNGNTIDDEKITIAGAGGGYAATACAAGQAKSADNVYQFEKGWFPGGGSRTVTITAKEACTVKILYTVCNGDFSSKTSAVSKDGELQWVLTPKDGEAQAAVSDTTNEGSKTSNVVYVSESISLAEGDSILLSVTGNRLILFGVEVV